MSHPLLILLLSTGALLITTEGRQSFQSLPELYRNTINLAIKEANKDAQQHMNYARTRAHKEERGHLDLRVYLKPTTCTKTGVDKHRDECTFLDKVRPIICVVCGMRSGSDIPDPYTDCVPFKNIKGREDIWNAECTPPHHTGGVVIYSHPGRADNFYT
ncbi:cystatin-like protein isoform X2 [Megalops cyprinoides]|uniref:cystatin-like protein isoform X2 n=1 Tax=Megalops cyprinoides TaxID=118141 RepID=UPI00186469ED|nr:cystatin-like protein isoform X2 [Megalops cyprinoides]